MSLKGISGNLLNNLTDLSSDMKFLLQSTLMADITLRVRGKYLIHCHKDILKFRSKWFYKAVFDADSKGCNQIEIDEDIHVIDAVLCYIYTGDLALMESLDICLIEILEVADKYGFCRLEEIFGRMVEDSGYHEIMKKTEFLWPVKVSDGNVSNAECHDLNGFTVDGKDRWRMKLKIIGFSSDDGYSIGIYLGRSTEEHCNTTHIVHYTISVIDCKGKCRFFFCDKYHFVDDCENLLPLSIPLTKLFNEPDILTHGVLTLSFKLTFVARKGFLHKLRLEGPYRKYISNELVHLSEDMYNIFKYGNTHDLQFSGGFIKIHSYILVVRSRIPKDCISLLVERANLGKRAWMSFAMFLYTGQSRYLDDHGRDVYTALCNTAFTMAKQKYSSFLAKNLTVENSFCILSDAVSSRDDNLITAAANFLASKSNIASDPQMWIKLAADKISFLKLFPQLYTFKQFIQ